jgi:Xaa-Pro aminopeptidase
MLVKYKDFSPKMLEEFKRLQTLSFSILEQMAGELTEGVTEKEVARELVKRYRANGFKAFFHLPVVLFGERTALPGNWKLGNFFPKSRTLAKNDAVIMDSAPLSKGFLVDTSYSFCFGENQVHQKMMADLAEYRSSILAAVNQGETFKKIADDVHSKIIHMGYEPVHNKHPGEVLGHRAVKTANLPFRWRLQGFDGLTLGWFKLKGELSKGMFKAKNPTWNQSPQSDHAPYDGLWLVEPHAGLGDVGAKWEEIMVIQNGKAHWLDDDVPHMRQWQQISSGNSYKPVVNKMEAIGI